MARWLHKTPLSDKRVPREAYQLAATYQLGMSIRQYSGIPTNILLGFSGIVAILDALFLMVRLGGPSIIFYLCNQPSTLASSPIYAICMSSGSRNEDLIGSGYAYRLGLVIALIFLVLGLILIARTIKELFRRSRTYQVLKDL